MFYMLTKVHRACTISPTQTNNGINTMNNYSKKLSEELSESIYSRIFDIEVTDLLGNDDWVVCEIQVQRNSLIAERVAVSSKEAKSKFIASTRIVIDSAFSLDEHLQELHEAVLTDIADGDLFNLNF